MVPLFILVVGTIGLSFGGIKSQAASASLNPGWVFQSSLYGKNSSGSYQFGVAKLNYYAVFNGTNELFTSAYVGENGTTLSVSTRLQNGSFDIVVMGSDSPQLVNEFITAGQTTASPGSYSPPPPDWQIAAHNQDSHSDITGAYVYYEYTGGSFPCNPTTCNQDMSFWLGFRTNLPVGTGYFFQVECVWGRPINPGPVLDNAPEFSIGYGNQLVTQVVGQSVINHQYVMQIFFDNLITQKWYFLIYDETAQSYVYYQSVAGATGTYLYSPYELQTTMEASSTSVDGSWIPNGQQNFYNLVYWDGNGNYYNWVNYPEFTHTSDAPTNIIPLVVSNGNYITEINWAYS